MYEARSFPGGNALGSYGTISQPTDQHWVQAINLTHASVADRSSFERVCVFVYTCACVCVCQALQFCLVCRLVGAHHCPDMKQSHYENPPPSSLCGHVRLPPVPSLTPGGSPSSVRLYNFVI